MNNKVKKVLPIIFSIAGSAGVIGTSVLAVKNSKKYYDSPHDVGAKAKIKEFFKFYWPSILAGTATIGSITAGTIISKKTEASLSAAVIMLEQGYNKYQNKVKDILGIDTHKNILKEIAKDETNTLKLPKQTDDGRILYYNNYIGHFYAKKEDVTRAILNMNMRLHNSYCSKMVLPKEKGICTIAQFVEESKAELLDKSLFNSYKDFGWTLEYLNDVAEDEWIYDGYCEYSDSEPFVTYLSFLTIDPIYIPNGWDHTNYLMEQAEKWHGTFISEPQCDENDAPPWEEIEKEIK